MPVAKLASGRKQPPPQENYAGCAECGHKESAHFQRGKFAGCFEQGKRGEDCLCEGFKRGR